MKDGKQCILIADDDQQIRQILELLLSSQGYAVIATDNGTAAQHYSGTATVLQNAEEFQITVTLSANV